MKKIRMFVASLLMLSMLVIPMSLNLTAVQAADGTGEVVLQGGSLTITVPASITYEGITIDGLVAKTSNATFDFSVTDATGTGSGWKVTMYSTVMTAAAHDAVPERTITAANHTFKASGAVALKSTDTGTAATNDAADQSGNVIPSSSGSAVKIYNAAADTGMGKSTVTVNTKLNVPLTAYVGTYNTTLTLSVVSGPN